MKYQKSGNVLKISEWHESDRPREKLLKHGPKYLSDTELLTIIIGTGSKGFSAFDCSSELLNKFDDLSKMVSADVSEFKSVRGLGKAKSITLSAVFEISKRIKSKPYELEEKLLSPEMIAGRFIPRFLGQKNEEFLVLLLNTSNQITRELTISKGSLNQTIVHPREVFKNAISESANSIVLLHNHPSGNPNPSKEDIKITRQLIDAGKIIDIKVLDHIIIAGEKFTSMRAEGIL